MALIASAAALLGACGGQEGSSGTSAQGTSITKLTLQLNWKAEPQFGGFYEAQRMGAFTDRGLDVQIKPGGAGVPTVQMIGAGSVEFGIVSGDELLIARARGNHLVALFAVYQTNPQGIMCKADRGLASIAEVFTTPGTLAMERGLPYALYLEQKYGVEMLKIVPSPFGDLTQLRTEPNYAMQCFVTSEPLAARKAGIDVTAFLIADGGWNPYTTVLACRSSYLKEHLDTVKNMVEAVKEGWVSYVADPTAANQTMQKLNPTMTAETFAASAAAQKTLIVPEGTASDGIGQMTDKRWQTLASDMKRIGSIDELPRVRDVYYQGN